MIGYKMWGSVMVLVIFVLLSLPVMAEAACSGASPTWTAASPARADVSDCYTLAVSGDRINVPAGSATWTSGLNVNTKDIVWSGAGNGTDPGTSTIITCTASFSLNLAIGSAVSSASRVTNFRFTNCAIGLRGLNYLRAFRIDNNYFENSVSASWNIVGGDSIANATAPQGLIDHNTFILARLTVSGTLFQVADDNLQRQHKIWSRDPGFGDAQAVYIEDNTMTQNIASGLPGVNDCNYGGHTVMRFNTITVTNTYAFEIHGVSAPNRGCQRWEAYSNTVTLVGSPNFTYAFLRGGTGFHFNNTLAGVTFNNGAALKVERASENKPVVGLCNGVSAPSLLIDALSANGWPCRDQIGRSRDNTLYTGNYNGTTGSGAWPDQASTPVYTWSNIQSGVQKLAYNFTAGTDAWNTENRDFYNFSAATGSPQTVGVRVGTLANRPAGCTTGVAYWATDQGSWNTIGESGLLYKCTATNTWTLLYTPYTYPHPLQGVDVVPPAAPTGVLITQVTHGRYR